MKTVHFVGGLLGDSLDTLTVSGHAVLSAAQRVIFPGDWIGPRVRSLLGNRLLWGRSLSPSHVLAAVQEVDTSVVLYTGDPSLFTGRFDAFPTARALDAMFREAGIHTEWHPGISGLSAALAAAGVEIHAGVSSALRASAEFALPGAAGAFIAADQGTDHLALLWFEDNATEVWRALVTTRGPDTRAHLVRGALPTGYHVDTGTLGSLQHRFPTLSPPAVLVVEPRGDDPLPPQTLKMARTLLDTTTERLVWITGLPGSGKSTLLRALQFLSPDVQTVELGQLIGSFAGSGGPGMGGLQRTCRAAEFLRNEVSESDASKRWFVASAGLPAAALAPRDRERVVLLDVSEETCRTRLASRRPRTEGSATPGDLTLFVSLVAEIRALGHCQILRVPGASTSTTLPSPFTEPGDR